MSYVHPTPATIAQVMRLAVSTYIAAGAFGVVAGTQYAALTKTLLPLNLGEPLVIGFVLLLTYFVMAGIWIRVSTLALALMTFWACYMQVLDPSVAISPTDLWRDVALVTGLLAAYFLPQQVPGSSYRMTGPTASAAPRVKPLCKDELRAMFSADLDGS